MGPGCAPGSKGAERRGYARQEVCVRKHEAIGDVQKAFVHVGWSGEGPKSHGQEGLATRVPASRHHRRKHSQRVGNGLVYRSLTGRPRMPPLCTLQRPAAIASHLPQLDSHLRRRGRCGVCRAGAGSADGRHGFSWGRARRHDSSEGLISHVSPATRALDRPGSVVGHRVSLALRRGGGVGRSRKQP